MVCGDSGSGSFCSTRHGGLCCFNYGRHDKFGSGVMTAAAGQSVERPALSRLSTAREGFTPALRSCGASMEALAMPPNLEAITSSLLFPSATKVPTNCSMNVLNHSHETNVGGNFSSLSKRHFPIFKGEHPYTWKANCLSYFHVYNIHKCMWVIAAAMHMEGKAKQWLQVYKMQHELGSWNQFMDAVLEKFGKHGHCQARIEVSTLRHRGEVNEDKSVQVEKTMFHASADVVWDEEIPADMDAHTSLLHQLVQGRELVCDELLPSLETHADFFPVEDEESIHRIDTHEGLLPELAMGMGDENTKGSAHVLLEGMSGHDVAQEAYDEILGKVVWDEEISAELDMNNDLLQLIASGEGYPDDMQLVDGSSRSMEFRLIDADHVFVQELDDSKVVWDDDFQHSDDKLPATWDDELPADLALQGELLKQLTSRMDCIDDKKLNSAVWLNTYQLSTIGVSQEGSSKPLLPINKWSYSFGDLESLEMHMPRAQTGHQEANLTDNGHMEPELGAPDYQLCKVTLEVTGSVSYLPWVLELDIATAQDVAEMSAGQEMNHNRETFASSEEKQGVSDLQVVFAESQQWMKPHTCKIQEAHEIPNLNKYSLYKVFASSRRQWDLGIMKLQIRQCFGCALKVAVGVIHRPAWGQAVFSGGGNVMTHMWPRRSPSDVRPINPSRPSAAQELHRRSAAREGGQRTIQKIRNRRRNRKVVFLLRFEILSSDFLCDCSRSRVDLTGAATGITPTELLFFFSSVFRKRKN